MEQQMNATEISMKPKENVQRHQIVMPLLHKTTYVAENGESAMGVRA
jgi:hypothetical protein